MGKHLGPRTLEPKCFTLEPKCRYPEFRKTSLRRNVSQRTLEPDGPLKHTIYKMSAHTTSTRTQTRGTIGRVSGRKVSTSSRSGSKFRAGIDLRTGRSKKQKNTTFKKHFRLCGNLLWGHANLSQSRSIFNAKVQRLRKDLSVTAKVQG